MMDLLSFPDNARIWIYASDQSISDEHVSEINKKILDFTKEWTSHQQALRATGGLLHNHFIVFVVDDGYNKPGGCSIDSSVRFIKSLGEEYQIDFFNRSIFYYLENEEVKSVNRIELANAIEKGSITEENLFFDTLVQTKSDFQHNWLKPLNKSWHRRLIY